MLQVSDSISIPEAELELAFARSGGPGGQNVNKVNSKAILHWNVTASSALPEAVRQRFLSRYRNRITKEGVLVLQSQKYRDQARNTEECRAKLVQLVLDVLAPPVKRKKTRPSRGANQRRLQEKKQTSERKQQRRYTGD
ncbi:MAG: alternative ribosome rescue aminoacyl-tRNA hydrolase ArfB [Planctomycetaceae bacterium]